MDCQAREKFASLKKSARDDVITELEEVCSPQIYFILLSVYLYVAVYLTFDMIVHLIFTTWK